MLKRLRIKFIIITMSIVTVMLCIIFSMVLHFTQQNLERSSLGMMQAMASEGMMPDRAGELPERVRLPFFIIETAPDGKLSVRGSEQFDLSDDAFIKALMDESLKSKSPSGILPEYGLRYFRSFSPRGEKLIFSDVSLELATMRDLRQSCLIIGIVSFFAFLGISTALAHWAVKPVEQAWNEQKQFVADASHELKTPLTVISANAELLHDAAFDSESRQGFAESILVMSGQMRSLVESLLELARIDGGAAAQQQELDLSVLLNEAVLPFEALYFEKGLELCLRVEDNIRVKGSALHLTRLVDILLDNGQKHSSSPGTVTLSLERQGKHALICMASPGDEIPGSELKNIFKRFYRLDKARSRDGSFGLGLSIAENIVSAHRGRIWAESGQGINRFFVQLPIL